jgi:hypothetical protein
MRFLAENQRCCHSCTGLNAASKRLNKAGFAYKARPVTSSRLVGC